MNAKEIKGLDGNVINWGELTGLVIDDEQGNPLWAGFVRDKNLAERIFSSRFINTRFDFILAITEAEDRNKIEQEMKNEITLYAGKYKIPEKHLSSAFRIVERIAWSHFVVVKDLDLIFSLVPGSASAMADAMRLDKAQLFYILNSRAVQAQVALRMFIKGLRNQHTKI